MNKLTSLLLSLIILCSCGNKKEIIIKCNHSNGVTTESELFLKGLKIGQVTNLKLDKDYKVLITANINDTYQLPSDSKFIIESKFINKPNITITPGKAKNYLLPSDTVTGIRDAITWDSLIINTVKKIVDSIPSSQAKRMNSNFEKLINDSRTE